MRKRRLFLEALEKRLVLSGVGQPDADQTGPDWQSVIVSFKDDVGDTRAVASALMQSVGGQVGHLYEHALTGFSAYLPAAAVKGLSNNPLVQSIEPNQVVQACGDWPAGTPYVVPHGVDRIDADLADSPQDWSGVDVAILDTGIDPNHPDLNVSTTGVHFYTRLTGPPPKRGAFWDSNFADDDGHGSHVAGIVGALDNDFGVVGVAPAATLWGVKVLDSRGYGTMADVAKGIDWVVERAADIEVINLSLGMWGESDVLHTAITSAVNAGIVVVVAAGNDGLDVYGLDATLGTADDFIPAAYPEVITISAMVDTDGIPGGFGPASGSGLDDTFASFSNYSAGGAIDLVLPGVNLWSTWWDGSNVQLSGTSMAAPHAAGLAARYIAGMVEVPDSAEDVYAVRQALIGNAVAQGDSLGLATQNDPDVYPEPIGWAGPSDLADYPPAINVIGPAAGATVSGTTVTLNAVVFNDDGAVDQVQFFVDNSPIGSDTDPDGGWSISWDTTGWSDGLHKITAIATEGSQSGTSSPIFVTVENGTVSDLPPSVSVTSPGDGQTVFGIVTVTANASDDNGVDQVEFFVDGTTSIGIDTNGDDGWSANWDTSTFANGPYTVTATATDTSVQKTTSDSVSVIVDNEPATGTMYIALEGTSTSVNKRKWAATVAVQVQDENEDRVSNATIKGTWSTGLVSTASTNDFGVATVFSGNVDNSISSVTFTVDSVTYSDSTYDLGGNTEITIYSPGTEPQSLTTAVEADGLEDMYHYLAGFNHSNKQSKKGACEQVAAVDLLMAYGL